MKNGLVQFASIHVRVKGSNKVFHFCCRSLVFRIVQNMQLWTLYYLLQNIIMIILKPLFQEDNTVSTELISLAALKYLQIIQINNAM